MGLVHRRWPLYVRPVPFAGLVAAAAALLPWGFAGSVSASLQTGNVLLLVRVPDGVVAWQGLRGVLFVLGAACLAGAFAVGTVGLRRAHRPDAAGAGGWRAARMRFYPVMFLLGVFLVYHGLAFLFDASVYGDDAPGGVALFVYLDYAGLLHRPLVSLVGAAVAAFGLVALTRGAFAWGVGRVPAVRAGPSARRRTGFAAPSPAAREDLE